MTRGMSNSFHVYHCTCFPMKDRPTGRMVPKFLTQDNLFNSYVALYRGSTAWKHVRCDPGEGFSGRGMSWVLCFHSRGSPRPPGVSEAEDPDLPGVLAAKTWTTECFSRSPGPHRCFCRRPRQPGCFSRRPRPPGHFSSRKPGPPSCFGSRQPRPPGILPKKDLDQPGISAAEDPDHPSILAADGPHDILAAEDPCHPAVLGAEHPD